MSSVRSTEPLVRRAEAGDVAVERLRHLEAITETALAHLALDDLLDELLLRLRELLSVDTAAVLLVEDEGGELVARAAKGLEAEVEAEVRIPAGQGFAGRVAAERRPIVISDLRREDVLNPILIEKGIKSILGVPLGVEDRVLGVVHVGSLVRREFTEADADLLQVAADRMALAIDHARLYEAERSAREEAEGTAERLRQVQSITDVALGNFSLDEGLLSGILARVRDVLGVDTAAILLLDTHTDELVARAAKGLEEAVERGIRIPVGQGFAGRIAADRAPVILREVDHTKVLNPILLERGIHSLLGVPLMVEGRIIGVLHVGALERRDFTSGDTALLELAADRIAIAIDRARQHSVARTLQESLLPIRLPAVAGLQLAARYTPGADEAHVGGDWYDVIRLPEGRIGLVMGDVVSRGVRAAAAMGQLRTAVRAFALDGASPAVVLGRLSGLVRASEDREMATVAYATFDPASGDTVYALAGHPPPLVLDPDGGTRFLEGGRSGPIGVIGVDPFAEASDHLRPGDTLLLYTDGLIERRGESLDEGLAKLRAIATRAGDMPELLCDGLVEQLGDASDDVAVLAARVALPAGDRLELRFHAVPESLSSMRRSLATWLTTNGADEDEAYDVMLAVGEAAANAVEHAYGPVEEEFGLTAEVTGGEVHLIVADSGRWRPPRGANRGRGLSLMSELMDDVDVESGDHGTLVHMRRHLKAGNAS
jgi:GAF domain-containing protein/anti-sigma regulatory factor (Ser/Thr protein kinase)